MIIADSDVLIDFLAGEGPAADRVAALIAAGALATTAINRLELLAGVRGRKQEHVTRELLDALPTLPADQSAADRAASIHRQLEQRGETIGMADSLIAGIALENGASLLTHNMKHFARITELTLIDAAR